MIRQPTISSIASILIAVAGHAQTTLFAEGFDAGIPATWTHLALGVPIDPWAPGVSPATSSPDVFHEWFCNHGGLTRNNVLVSPAIDLRGFTQATFSCVQHQTFPLQRSVNRVEVTVDAGQSFVLLYEETGTWSGPGVIQASLDAFTGLPDVRVAFHYEGAVANEWRIDDVLVTSPQPRLTVQGLVAGGVATLQTADCTPGAFVVFALSLAGPGPLPSPWGPLGLTPPIALLPLQVALASGGATVGLPVPANAAGTPVFLQAADFPWNGPFRISNSIATLVP